jgi:hypothetical protein
MFCHAASPGPLGLAVSDQPAVTIRNEIVVRSNAQRLPGGCQSERYL